MNYISTQVRGDTIQKRIDSTSWGTTTYGILSFPIRNSFLDGPIQKRIESRYALGLTDERLNPSELYGE
jgi:hypothetical protein